MEDAEFLLSQAEREHSLRRSVENPDENADPLKVPGRKTPRERQLELLKRQAVANPGAVALRLIDQAAEISALKEQLKKQEKKSEMAMDSLKEDLMIQKERLVEELIHSGLNRRSIMSEKYHAQKPWVSKFLFGKPWKEHKARGEACFGRIVSGFDVHVSGGGEVAHFEKYCMCVMIAWQGFLNPLVAAIYGRSISSISRYKTEWMPLLGIAGANMSELDMEMNHNWLDINYCKENDLPYFNIDLSDD